jgi:hypothetical protein
VDVSVLVWRRYQIASLIIVPKAKKGRCFRAW